MNAARLFYCKVVTAEPPVELRHKHSCFHGSSQYLPAASRLVGCGSALKDITLTAFISITEVILKNVTM